MITILLEREAGNSDRKSGGEYTRFLMTGDMRGAFGIELDVRCFRDFDPFEGHLDLPRGAGWQLHASEFEMELAIAMQMACRLGANDNSLQFGIHREKQFLVWRKYRSSEDSFDRRAYAIGSGVERSHEASEGLRIFRRSLAHRAHLCCGNHDGPEINGVAQFDDKYRASSDLLSVIRPVRIRDEFSARPERGWLDLGDRGVPATAGHFFCAARKCVLLSVGLELEHGSRIRQNLCSEGEALSARKNQSIEINANEAVRRKVGVQIRGDFPGSGAVFELNNAAIQLAASGDNHAIKCVDRIRNIGLN